VAVEVWCRLVDTAIMARAQELGMPRDQYMKTLDAAQRRACREWQE
jgi:hypothetical protein